MSTETDDTETIVSQAKELAELRSSLAAAREENRASLSIAKRISEENETLLAERTTLAERAERIRLVGARLANMAFNLSQQSGEKLIQPTCDLLNQLRREWDAALTPPPQDGT